MDTDVRQFFEETLPKLGWMADEVFCKRGRDNYPGYQDAGNIRQACYLFLLDELQWTLKNASRFFGGAGHHSTAIYYHSYRPRNAEVEAYLRQLREFGRHLRPPHIRQNGVVYYAAGSVAEALEGRLIPVGALNAILRVSVPASAQ